MSLSGHIAKNILSLEILARIIDGFPVPLFVIDTRHRVVHWNTALEMLTGINRNETIGTDQHWRIFYTKQRPTMADLVLDGASEEQIRNHYSIEITRSGLNEGGYEAENFVPSLGKDGKSLYFMACPIKDGNGMLMGAMETMQDITDHRRALQALHESEKSFRALFESASDAIWVNDMDGNIITANKAAADLSCYPMEDLLKMNAKQFLSDDSLSVAREVRYKLLKEGSPAVPYEQRLIRSDGSEAICMITTSLIVTDGEPQGFHNIARDVTEEKRMEENLRYYLQQITRAQEEERKRIARELHDDTAQVLGSLSRQLDNFLRKHRRLSSSSVSFLKELQAQINRGAEDVHRFSQALRLSVLDDFGLIPALRSLTKSLQDYHGVSADIKIIGKERRLPSEVELLLFRIVQEALNNVGRHAQASETKVVLEFVRGKVRVTISDNGRGFELEGRLDDLPRSGKLGLAGIRERAKLIGGNLEVTTAPGEGTTLRIEVPI